MARAVTVMLVSRTIIALFCLINLVRKTRSAWRKSPFTTTFTRALTRESGAENDSTRGASSVLLFRLSEGPDQDVELP